MDILGNRKTGNETRFRFLSETCVMRITTWERQRQKKKHATTTITCKRKH